MTLAEIIAQRRRDKELAELEKTKLNISVDKDGKIIVSNPSA
ncbi:hypothetical protein [Cytobacillus sp.]|nr:hypothetical protein [Cytobacillus sp.]